MKKFALITTALVAIAGASHAQSPVTTTTSTTAETPIGTVTTTTDVTTPQQVVPQQQVPAQNVPTARDAITGEPVDTNAAADNNDDLSLRDKVRAKISNEAKVKP